MHDEINVDARNYGVSDHSVYHVGEHEQHSMKEQMIAVQLQSQMSSYILHYHLQQKHIQLIKLNYKKK